MWDSIVNIVIGIGGSALGYLARHYLSVRTWGNVKKVATAVIADPQNPTTDPVKAVTDAFIQENLDRIAKTADQVKQTLNGIHE